jgi:homoprotocatechuate degradation regulator HpaR
MGHVGLLSAVRKKLLALSTIFHGIEPTSETRNNRLMSDVPPPFRQTRRSLPIALLRARETVMGPLRDMLATSGVNEQKWRVLRVLQERGPLELSQVAAEAVLLLSSLTRMVGPMVEEGLISRMTPPEDRRKTVVAITPTGLALVNAHAGQSAAILGRIETDFGRKRLETLLDLLEDLQKLDLRNGGTVPGQKPKR